MSSRKLLLTTHKNSPDEFLIIVKLKERLTFGVEGFQSKYELVVKFSAKEFILNNIIKLV